MALISLIEYGERHNKNRATVRQQFSIIATEIDGCDKFSFVIDVNERN